MNGVKVGGECSKHNTLVKEINPANEAIVFSGK